MEQWIKKLSGAVVASVLALTLSSKASADLLEDDTDPDQPLPQYEENLTEGEGDGAPGFDGDEIPAPTREVPASGDENGEDGGGESDGSSDSDEAGVITLSNTEDPDDVNEFTPGKDDTIDLSSLTEDQYDRIGFDAGEDNNNDNDPADDCFYMVDFDGSDYDLTSENSDINIKAAGLNRLHGIKADGNVNLTGTGILLVDSIELSAGSEFYLHPIEGLYSSGGVAVFLRQSEAGEGTNAVYSMINGSDAPGILDESYVIPAGIDLVLPSGNTLILQSTIQQTVAEHMDDDGNIVPEDTKVYTTQPSYTGQTGSNYSYEYSAPRLTVPASSNLTVQSGAAIESVTLAGEFGGENILPIFNVNGGFENSGTIYGGTAGGILVFGETSQVSGDGVYKDCRLYFNSLDEDSQNVTFNIVGTVNQGHYVAHLYVGCDLIIDNVTLADDRPVSLGAANVTGGCDYIVADGSSIGTIDLSDSSTVTIYAHSHYEDGCTIYLRDGITGSGKVILAAGNYVIAKDSFVLSDSVTVTAIGQVGDNTKPYSVTVSDVSGKLFSKLAVTDLGIKVDPNDVTLPRDPVDVYKVNIESYQSFWDNSIAWEQNTYAAEPNWMVMDLAEADLITDGKVFFADLQDQKFFSTYLNSNTEPNGPDMFVEVYTISDGVLTRHVIRASDSYGDEDYISAGEIWQIRLVSQVWRSEAGGTSVMSTDTSITGSGILGGSGAGSMTGGAGSSIFTGTGITDNSGSNDDDNDNSNDSAPVVNPQPGAQQNVVVTVTSNDDSGQQADALEELESVFTLSAAADGQIITDLNGSITVRFSCPAPETNGMIFVVFRNSDGSLKVFRARFDRITGQLVFDCDMLGDFAVVCIDYKGDINSNEFYALLESFDSVKKLN